MQCIRADLPPVSTPKDVSIFVFTNGVLELLSPAARLYTVSCFNKPDIDTDKDTNLARFSFLYSHPTFITLNFK